jgi:polar amino acid transport system substrate-binding protein
MKAVHYVLVVIVALIAGYAGSCLVPHKSVISSEKKVETAFERVMRTNTLRCGYIVWPPEFNKDPNTGAFSGIDYDIITELAKRLNWKVEWAEEVNFTTMAAALKAGRFDAICFGLYRDAPRASFAHFTSPFYYSGTGVYVRSDDERFDTLPIASLNSETYAIATMDGEMSAIVAKARFPNAKQVTIPSTASPTDLFQNVSSKKADLTFANTLVGAKYMEANPGVLKNIAATDPIQVFSHGIAFRKEDADLVNTVDIVLQEMQDQGAIDRILDTYSQINGAFYRMAKPYRQ